jgi:hypothetical protein
MQANENCWEITEPAIYTQAAYVLLVSQYSTTASPKATGFTINGGDAARSRITSITLNFDSPVTAANFTTTGAIRLTRTAAASRPTGAVNDVVQTGPAGLNHITVTQGTATSLILTFDNNGAFNTSSNGIENGSLTDGYWQLTCGTFISPLNDVTLRRLYGDSTATANGVVDGSDLLTFGNAFATNSLAFDFDNDGTVGGSDFLVLGNRFGNSL